MIASDTGKQQTLHLPNLKLPVAVDLNRVMEMIANYPPGHGEVTFTVRGRGNVPTIKWTMQLNRQKP